MTDGPGLSGFRGIALAVRFLLELALLAASALIGWRLAEGGWRFLAASIAVLVVAVVWGLLLSPKARFDVGASAHLGIEAILFLGAGAGLIALGHGPAGIGLILVWAADRAALGRDPRRTAGPR